MPPGVDRRFGVTPHRRSAEALPRLGVGGIGGDGVPKRVGRGVELVRRQFDEAQVVPGAGRVRVAPEQFVKHGARLTHASQLRVGDAEIVEDLGVLVAGRARALESRRGALEIARSSQCRSKLRQDLGGRRLRRRPVAKKRDGVSRPIARHQHGRRTRPRRDEIGTLADQREEPGQCLGGPPGIERLECPVEALVERHQPFGIVSRAVCLPGRRLRGGRVPQRSQSCGHIVVHACRRGDPAPRRHEPGERALQRVATHILALDDVSFFAGIRAEIVDLGERQVDVLPIARHDPCQRSPGAGQVRLEGFEIQRAIGGRRTDDRLAVEVRRRRDADEFQDGREEVVVCHRHVDDAATDSRSAHNQRHGQGRVVREQPVRRLAMIAERFAVVGGRDDHGVIECVGGAEPVEQLSEHRIGVGDLGIVRRAPRAVCRGRVVRCVRIEQMNPCEPGAARLRAFGASAFAEASADRRSLGGGWSDGPAGARWIACERRRGGRGRRIGAGVGTKNPVACRLHDLRGAAVGDSERRGVRLVWIAVVVLVEPAAEPETRIEDEGADEGARPVAGTLQHGRQSGDAFVQTERTICVDAVRAWRAAGENRGMRRQRHRRVRVRVGVTDTRRGKAIERRCEASAIAVRAEPIAAERVNCHQQHVATAQVAGLQ